VLVMAAYGHGCSCSSNPAGSDHNF
jgi:hypothetical protein